MGFFDNLSNTSPNDPSLQGLAALGQALTQAGAPSRIPMSFAQRLGDVLPQYSQQMKDINDRRTIQKAIQAQNPADLLSSLSNVQNPDIQKAILSNRLAAMTPKYDVTKDAAGNPIAYNSLNPTQAMRVGGDPMAALNGYDQNSQQTPQGGNAPAWQGMIPQASSQQPQSMGMQQNASAQPTPQGIDQNYLSFAKKQSPIAGSMAESMINGVFKPGTGKGANDPNYVMALQIAQRADPTFTPQSVFGRPEMVENATKGKMYDASVNLNTAMSHLYDLHQLAPGLKNGSVPFVNTFTNFADNLTGLGAYQDVRRYNSTVSEAAPEIAKYLGGGQATDAGTAEAQIPYNPNQPAPVIQQNATDMASKMMAKAGSLQNEYNSTMGAAARHKVSQPMTDALFADMQGKPLTSQQQQLVNQHREESNLPAKTWDNNTQKSSQKLSVKMTLPPAAAIAYLKANPGQAAAFESKYNIPAKSFLGGN